MQELYKCKAGVPYHWLSLDNAKREGFYPNHADYEDTGISASIIGYQYSVEELGTTVDVSDIVIDDHGIIWYRSGLEEWSEIDKQKFYQDDIPPMRKTITGILVDTVAEEACVKTIPAELHEYYKVLDCDTIECTDRMIGGECFTIICDEEGLMKRNKLSAIDEDGHAQLVGNLFIVQTDYDTGDFRSLTEEEQKKVLERCLIIGTVFYPDGVIALVID